MKLSNIYSHYKTISDHRRLVRQGCFRVGLFFQGITHDLSKYSPAEFIVGAKYYQGFRSPNNAEREDRGYSSAWLHHKGRNKHHFEYWLDYSSRIKGFVPVRMPNIYLVEMYMDRLAASKTYNKGKYDDTYPLKYYLKGKDSMPIDEHTKAETEKLLKMLSVKGEKYTERYIRRKLLSSHPGAVLVETLLCIKEVRSRRISSKDQECPQE